MDVITRSFSKFLLAVCLLISTVSIGQTNPAAQTLPYTQNFGTTTFTSMPTGTAAWNGLNGATVNTQALAEASAPTGNATVTGIAAASPSGNSYGYASASNAAYYIQTSGNTTNGVNQLATAINTGAGVTSVRIGYDIRAINSSPNTMGIVLQYRLGTSGSWTTVSGSAVLYNDSSTNGGDIDSAGDSDSYSYIVNGLTASTAYQFRWAVWRGSLGGNSTGLGIDNISIAASTINGSIAAGEYGTHANGANQQTNGSTVTYMNWDANYLYVGFDGASAGSLAEGYVLYLDKDPQPLVNGGTNANGTLVGQGYDNANFAALPFRADIVVYAKSGYNEYRTANGANGWNTQVVNALPFGASVGSPGTELEFAL